MPIAGPPTAATMGFESAGSTSKKRQLGDFVPGGRLRKSDRSLPAVKQSRLPWMSTARASRSASAAASASAICTYISVVIAFFLSSRASSMRATRSLVSARTKLVVLHLLAQRQLGQLAGGGMRQLFDEHHVVGHPPFGDLAFVELEQLLPGNILARLLHRHDDRPLVPFRMLYADHRGLGDRRVRHRDVLEVDRADPFAARLDHVLRAVGDLDVAVGIDGADVAGREPALAQWIAALALEITLDDPRAAHLQVAEGLAVPRQLLAVLADDAHVDAEKRAPLLALELCAIRLAPLHVLRLEGGGGAERAHLGHAPCMQHAHAVLFLESVEHCRRTGRAADHHALERAEAQLLLLHEVEQSQPYRRDARAHG